MSFLSHRVAQMLCLRADVPWKITLVKGASHNRPTAPGAAAFPCPRLRIGHGPMIKRVRLTEQLVDQTKPYWLVEAGAGFGKSVLLDDLRRSLISSLIIVRQPISDRSKLGFLASLAEAANRAGHPETAAAVMGADGDARLIADAFVAAERGLAIDDVHRWEDDAASFVVALLEAVDERCKIVLAGRTLPPSVAALRDTNQNILGPRDLAFTENEIAQLIGDELGDPLIAKTLLDLSDGWPIAVSAAVFRLAAATDPIAVAQELGRHESMIDSLFQDQLDSLESADRDALRDLSALPFFDAELSEQMGSVGLFDRLTLAGVPILRRPDGWAEVSGQFRAALVRLAGRPRSLSPDVIDYFVARGEIQAAIGICVAAGEHELAASVIAELTSDQQTRLEPASLNAAITALGDAVESSPRCLLVQAQVNASFGRIPEGFQALDRAHQLWAQRDPNMADAQHLELLLELALWRGTTGDVESSQALLDLVAPIVSNLDDIALQAHVLDVQGILHHQEGDAAALESASAELTEALGIWRKLAEPRLAAVTVFRLSAGVLADRGRRSEALDLLDSLPDAGPLTLLNRARLGLERSLLLPYLGRAREVADILAEPRRLGHLLGHEWLVGWTYWSEIVAASFCYDGPEVARLVEVFDQSGYVVVAEVNQVLVWCDAAEALARCERFDEARIALERAKSYGFGHWLEDYTAASIEARCGDPIEAHAQLDSVASIEGIDQDHLWRTELLRSYALHRGGQSEASQQALARCVEMAKGLGQASLPDIVDGRLVAQIQSSSPQHAHPVEALVQIRLFDRFEVVVNGAPLPLASGHLSTLVKVMVMNHGHMVIDQVIDVLWPDTNLTQGRKRLRNVLNRLRDAGLDIIVREGEALTLMDGVASDFQRASQLADAALQPRASAAVIAAGIAANERELLAGDRYEEWAEQARLDQRRRLIMLLDAQAATAEATGDLDTTVDALRRAHELDEWRVHRLDAAASLLRAAGREAAALALTGE